MVDNRHMMFINDTGITIDFTQRWGDFVLQNIDGIYGYDATVSTTDNTVVDGSTYLGSVLPKRNIVVTLVDKENHRDHRFDLYALFKPKTTGRFVYIEDEISKQINCYVESIEVTSTGVARIATISLICPDPYFEDMNDTWLVMAGWQPMFEFKHEFQFGGEPLGIRIANQMRKVINTSASDNIGIQIVISAIGEVTNPSIFHVEQGKHLIVGTDSKPLQMVMGDQLIITTMTNNKHVWFIHNGEQINANTYLTEDSEFFQLNQGSNAIGFDADSGRDYMVVDMYYRFKYLGV